MAKPKESKFVKEIRLKKPLPVHYYIPLDTDKDKYRFISRVEKAVRSSMEYRDYITFLKNHMDLDRCIFFQNITSKTPSGKRITIELHHEPFTLYDIVSVVLAKFIEQGEEINTLRVADEVLRLHYEDKVGLVPLTKTAHQMIHNSTKLMIPINMCFGHFDEFLEEYEPWIDESLFDKFQKKLEQTERLTMESFNALVKEFTYLDVAGVEDPDKLEIETKKKRNDDDTIIAA